MKKFTSELAEKITPPYFIGLKGEMGAGKTTFTQILVNELFQKEEIVTSPTFSIINIYEKDDFKIVHADLFRLETYDDLVFSGIEEYLFDNDAVVIAEWYDKVEFIPPKPNILIDIKIISEDEREFSVLIND